MCTLIRQPLICASLSSVSTIPMQQEITKQKGKIIENYFFDWIKNSFHIVSKFNVTINNRISFKSQRKGSNIDAIKLKYISQWIRLELYFDNFFFKSLPLPWIFLSRKNAGKPIKSNFLSYHIIVHFNVFFPNLSVFSHLLERSDLLERY